MVDPFVDIRHRLFTKQCSAQEVVLQCLSLEHPLQTKISCNQNCLVVRCDAYDIFKQLLLFSEWCRLVQKVGMRCT
jgi:hypothetical protein